MLGRVLGGLVTFFVVFMAVGAGIVLVLETLGSSDQVAAAAVLGLVVTLVALTSAAASKSREWIANPYW
jgi:hypothetical protein